MTRLLVALVLFACSVLIAPPAHAAQTIGFPTFTGPAVPASPAPYTTGDMMRKIYDAESSGTDFWMDRLLARTGNDPAGPWLMSRGRALFMKEHDPTKFGFGGKVAYWESINDNSAYTVALTPGTFTEQVAQRRQTPSRWKSVHTAGSVTVEQTKFITDNNVAVTNLSIKNNGSASTTLQLRATSPYATTGTGSELTGQVNAYNNLTTIRPRLTGDGFTVASGGLGRSVTVAAGATVTAKVVMGFVTDEIPASLTEYNAYAGYSNATAFATHVKAYNRWWAENVPYIDVPEPAIKKNICMEELSDPRRPAGDRGQPRPLRGGRRQGPARQLRPRQQQAHRVRLGRPDRQRRRRGLLPLEAGQHGPRRVRLPVQRSAGRGAGVRGDGQHGQGDGDAHPRDTDQGRHRQRTVEPQPAVVRAPAQVDQ